MGEKEEKERQGKAGKIETWASKIITMEILPYVQGLFFVT